MQSVCLEQLFKNFVVLHMLLLKFENDLLAIFFFKVSETESGFPGTFVNLYDSMGSFPLPGRTGLKVLMFSVPYSGP